VNPASGDCGHGYAADGPDAAAKALNAGLDSEMTSTLIRDFGAQLVANHQVSITRINDAVKRILRVKFEAGLFDHPYVDVSQAGRRSCGRTRWRWPVRTRPAQWCC
jgi:beta-glucosidase